ncbi:hypothetical protein [Caulobacter sp. NIBR1757]|uniref:hypothetical protein n=1 Tax=Caulobacter sp. NIBR1757 TaxID=3016000 RepID=UPI0022F0D0D3|nr:hypothetical protein [Caulobacter sp. NIBR1757]
MLGYRPARWTAWFSGLLFVSTLLCISLLTPSSALAAWTAPTGTKGWATVVGPGTFEYFATPDEACRRQKALYAPISAYGGVRDTATYNHIKQCIWTPAFGDSAPSTVDLQCHAGYIRTPDGQCRNDPFACFGPCPANGGGSPTAMTARPVDIITGAKQFRTIDFEDAAGHLFLNRVYASKRYGDFATPSGGRRLAWQTGSSISSSNCRYPPSGCRRDGSRWPRQTVAAWPLNVKPAARCPSTWTPPIRRLRRTIGLSLSAPGPVFSTIWPTPSRPGS